MSLYPSQDSILEMIFSRSKELFKHHESLILGGGTALARAYLNHRRSYDLDLFIDEPLQPDALYQQLIKLGFQLTPSPIINQEGPFARQLHSAILQDGEVIKISVIEDLFCGMFEQQRIQNCWTTEEVSGLYHRKIRTLSGTGTQTNRAGMPIAQGARQQARDLFDLYTLSNQVEPMAPFVKRINRYGAGVPLTQLIQGISAIPWMEMMEEFEAIETISPHKNITAMEAKRFFDGVIKALVQPDAPAEQSR